MRACRGACSLCRSPGWSPNFGYDPPLPPEAGGRYLAIKEHLPIGRGQGCDEDVGARSPAQLKQPARYKPKLSTPPRRAAASGHVDVQQSLVHVQHRERTLWRTNRPDIVRIVQVSVSPVPQRRPRAEEQGRRRAGKGGLRAHAFARPRLARVWGLRAARASARARACVWGARVLRRLRERAQGGKGLCVSKCALVAGP